MDHSLPLLNTTDIDILAHKEAHFGGNFPTMIEYYKADGVGVMPDFSLQRIEELYAFEKTEKINLADEAIPPGEKERIARARTLYTDLREVYGTAKPDAVPTLISDLILTEDEEATREIAALVRKGKESVEALLLLIQSDNFYDPLYPGYGRAPVFAAKVLQKIGDERAIQPLFEAMGQENFFTDDAMIGALASFGDRARKFLLQTLKHKPFNKDNGHAAIVLSSMEDHPDTGAACLELLQEEKVPFFAHYLVFGCAGLEDATKRDTFKAFLNSNKFSDEIKNEIKVVINNFS